MPDESVIGHQLRRPHAKAAEVVSVLVAWALLSAVFFVSDDVVRFAKLIPTIAAIVIAFSRDHGRVKWAYLGVGAVAVLAMLFAMPAYSIDSALINP